MNLALSVAIAQLLIMFIVDFNSLDTIGESNRPISLIFYADAISLLINARKTAVYNKPFEQIVWTQFTYYELTP